MEHLCGGVLVTQQLPTLLSSQKWKTLMQAVPEVICDFHKQYLDSKSLYMFQICLQYIDAASSHSSRMLRMLCQNQTAAIKPEVRARHPSFFEEFLGLPQVPFALHHTCQAIQTHHRQEVVFTQVRRLLTLVEKQLLFFMPCHIEAFLNQTFVFGKFKSLNNLTKAFIKK